MDKAENRFCYHLGSAHGARDSCDRVSWLSAHLLDFPAHEAPLQERARVRSIFHSLPRAQVGTVDSEYHPQHKKCFAQTTRSHRTGSSDGSEESSITDTLPRYSEGQLGCFLSSSTG